MDDYTRIAERLAKVEQDNDNLHHRLTETNKRVEGTANLAESIHTLANEVVHMREDINRMDKRLTDVEIKPGKRWDLVLTAVITAICSGAVGMVLSKLFV